MWRRNKKPPAQPAAFRLSKKLRRIFRASGKQSHNILRRGVYLVQNTSQAASVEYVRQWRTYYARSRLQKNWRKSPKGFFDKLKAAGSAGGFAVLETIRRGFSGCGWRQCSAPRLPRQRQPSRTPRNTAAASAADPPGIPEEGLPHPVRTPH